MAERADIIVYLISVYEGIFCIVFIRILVSESLDLLLGLSEWFAVIEA